MFDALQPPKVIAINIAITFIEGFLAAWLVTGNELSRNALLGGAAAGASAVWNLVLKPLFKTNGILYKKV